MSNEAVLVTGGARGIGAGISKRLRSDGYDVVVLDLLEPEAGFEGAFHQVDLSDASATEAVLSTAVRARVITRLVNNVGIVRPALVEETTLGDFEAVMNLNARTALMCVQALLPAMRKRQFGRIVSITSRALLGKEKRSAYAASKGALAAMTRCWALELASDGITANTIAPGPIATEAFFENNPADDPRSQAIIRGVPVGRLGTAEDVAHSVSFLLDERSGFVTGQTLYVCGGLTVGLSGGG